MRGTGRVALSWYHYQLALDLRVSSRRRFVCADCRKSLQNEERVKSQRRHASSAVRRSTFNRSISGLSGPVEGSRQYHRTLKRATAADHHSTSSRDDPFISTSQFPLSEEPSEVRASPIRQRLRQWRKEHDTPDTIVGHRDAQHPSSLAATSTQAQILASDSMGGNKESEDLDTEEIVDHDPDPLGGYNTGLSELNEHLSPGDLVEIMVPGASGSSQSLCICVRLLDFHTQLITTKGCWYMVSDLKLKSGVIEKFASVDELAPLIPYLPDKTVQKQETGTPSVPIDQLGDIPIDVTGPIVRRLTQLEHEISAFLRTHARRFEGLYEMLADDEELIEWEMEDLVPMVFDIPYSKLSTAGRLAIARFASHREHGLRLWVSGRKTRGYWVRSRQDLRLKNLVVDWARMYQESAAKAALGKDVKEDLQKNPLSAFINKAHRLILRSRKIRSPTTVGILGPSARRDDGSAIRAVDAGETLTQNDKMIMQFIFATSHMSPLLVPPRAHSICALIYRAIGAYPNLPLGRKVARLLLQELGGVPPWAGRWMYRYHLRLPGLGIWPYQEKLVARAEAACKDLNVFWDSVRHMRKDWGQLPVYCIDNRDTLEIDDGISVERDDNMPGCSWIHVHIANPAAYISREHAIAAVAEDVLSSVYTPSKKFSMIPRPFAETISSLGADRPVMTISTLLQADGSVIEVKMSLGIIHNVIKLTHSAVDAALEVKSREVATMVIGGQRPAQDDDGKDAETLKQALPDLRLVRQLLSHRFQKRLADWPEEEKISRTNAVMRCKVWTNLREEPVSLSFDKINHWSGDPIIVIEGDRYPRVVVSFDDTPVVEHAMLLAGESAAKWCKDKDIPILYHVAIPHHSFPVSTLNKLEDTDFRIEPAGRMSTIPQPHWALNMWQYTRITSPIRRYADLVNQWQIQAYLETNNRRSQDHKDLPSSHPLSRLPFSRQELKDLIQTLTGVTALKQAAWQADQHWINQAFFRAFHFKEAELPDVWDFKVIRPAKYRSDNVTDTIYTDGILVPFRAAARLLYSEEKWEKDVKRSQFLPVKIDMVDPELDIIFVRAVGPPSDNPMTTHPIHIESFHKSDTSSKDGPVQQNPQGKSRALSLL